MESLSDIVALPVMVGMALMAGAERARTQVAEERADDSYVASQIHGTAATAHARVAADWQTRAILAEAEIVRLRLAVDEMVMDRADLIAQVGALLDRLDGPAAH
jgi:nitrogen fixation protein FixH